MRKTAIIFFLAVFNHAYSQIDDILAEPNNLDRRDSFNKLIVSPETAAFHKVNFLPVNLYTGKPNIDIPLYAIKTGDIEIPISLKYDIGANKVDDIATNTGWGWSLQAGGNVTRMVRDIDDHDHEYAGVVTTCRNTIGCDDYGLQTHPGKVTTIGYLRRLNDKAMGTDATYSNLSEDALPDLFLAQAPGISTQFYLERNFGTYDFSQAYNPIVLDGSSVNIWPVYYKSFNVESIKDFAGFNHQDAVPHIRYNYIFHPYSNNGVNADNPIYQIRGFDGLPGLMRTKSIDYENFNLVNGKGVRYVFSTYDINESLPSFEGEDSTYWRMDSGLGFPNLRHIGTSYRIRKNTWHLDKIKDNKNKEVNFLYKPAFTFNYEKSPVYIGTSEADIVEVNKIYNTLGTGDFSNNITPGASIEDKPEYENLYKTTQQQILDKITWDQGEVQFFYNLSRKDRLDSKALTEIKVKNKAGNTVKHYKLNYTYFQSTDTDCPANTQNAKCYRLKLDKIDEMTTDSQIASSYSLTYNQEINIPKVNSLSKDFLGYYNGKPNQMFQRPSFTFSPNKNRLSAIPFQSSNLNTNEFIKVSGDADLSPNNQSLNGLLTKITYPAGGKTEFEYENNTFSFYGNDLLSAGARIKSQRLDDGRGHVIVKKYEYLMQNGKSSGSILNFPKIVDLISWSSTNKKLRFYTSIYSRSNVELTQGAYVGYSRILERTEGNGMTEYIYNSSAEYPNEYEMPGTSFFSKHSFYPGRAYVDHDNKRGMLSHKYIYAENGTRLVEENFKYDGYKELNTKVRNFTVGGTDRNGEGFYIPYKEAHSIRIVSSINKPSSKEVIEYANGQALKTKTEYTYSNNTPSNLTEEKITIPSGDVIKKNTLYLKDYPDAVGLFTQVMTAKNMVSIPMGTKDFKNDIKVSEERTVYFPTNPMAEEGTTPYLPKKYYKSFGSENIVFTEDKHNVAVVDKYDDDSNIIRYSTREGNVVGIVWGYNNTLPIAKIEGKDAGNLMGIFDTEIKDLKTASNNDVDQATEKILMAKLDAFQKRQHNMDVKISTYTYDPLIGITSTTPPSGVREIYVYDSSNRLKEIKQQQENDGAGNAVYKPVQEFKYNYKN